jgi:hypothetical protein
VKLDRRLRRHAGELVGGQGVKRRTLRQETGDLGQAGVQLALLRVTAAVI